jgi:general secretion pathway protein B
MSFILDALKKSENARQRQIGPAMAELPRRRRSSERPIWAFVVGALLLVNIGVLGMVLARKKGNEAQPGVSAAMGMGAPSMAANPAMQPLPAGVPTVLPARPAAQYPAEELPMQNAPVNANAGMVSSLAEESGTMNASVDDAGLAAAVAAAQAELAREEQPAAPIQAPAVAPLGSAGAQVRNAPMAGNRALPGEILPTIQELAASGRTFPDMRINVHSFADKPAERFVFVNMRKYGEGQTLQEGPAIERITEEGVVLNQQGLRFLLPRP